MARSIATILALMDAEQAAQTGLSGLNSVSNSSIYKLWKYIVAAQMFLQETLWDIFKTDIETQVSLATPGTPTWLKDKILNYFQYSSVTPQILELVNFVPTYPIVDSNLRIITRCAISNYGLNTCLVKVAKSDPPQILLAAELTALNSFLNNGGDGTIAGSSVGLGFAGINYNVQSYNSDKLYLVAEIVYNGQYSNTIQENVETAINNYLSLLPFDSKVKITALTDAIQLVEGVSDVIITDLAMRSDATAFANKTYLVQNKTTILSSYPTFAGYIVEETTASNTFADTLTYTAE
jgi:hypothetical protein